MAKNNIPETQSVNLLGQGTEISGDIISNGDFRIDGTLKGSIKSQGKIVVGHTGKIEGEMTCKNADISGEVNAKITISELLTMKSTAKFCGDIITNKLAIEPGAKFSGSCKMENQETNGAKFSLKDERNRIKEKIA
ncbi:MAG: polymer-forming cytoskeletal protein [Bacteroidales bacterium]|nr:polymer-forming cytoskeletal protein [Bacteroidales bacterium]